MCFDVEAGYKRKIQDGIRTGGPAKDINVLIDNYNERFEPIFPMPHVHHHVSAFAHPEIGIVHLEAGKLVMEPMVWGLIPKWTKDKESSRKIWNMTGNARSETMFEKPSFKASARNNRGVVVLDSFYEHHHFSGNAYPFNVKRKNGGALVVAVLWSEWTDKEVGEVVRSFSIVTTEGNEMMSVIHNNPKKKEPRMPVILEDAAINVWLGTEKTDDMHLSLLPLCKPLPKDSLQAHAVRPLRGKRALGNVPEAIEAFEYPELGFDTELNEVLH
ncbi:MAG: putative SOS response-associated peptidase YedK [Bacteroidia bacterium]|jgi:putative SOS response-associated peptidase YedK